LNVAMTTIRTFQGLTSPVPQSIDVGPGIFHLLDGIGNALAGCGGLLVAGIMVAVLIGVYIKPHRYK
jgi:hypothetical protein